MGKNARDVNLREIVVYAKYIQPYTSDFYEIGSIVSNKRKPFQICLYTTKVNR